MEIPSSFYRRLDLSPPQLFSEHVKQYKFYREYYPRGTGRTYRMIVGILYEIDQNHIKVPYLAIRSANNHHSQWIREQVMVLGSHIGLTLKKRNFILNFEDRDYRLRGLRDLFYLSDHSYREKIFEEMLYRDRSPLEYRRSVEGTWDNIIEKGK